MKGLKKMYKKAISVLVLFSLLILAGQVCITGVQINKMMVTPVYQMKVDEAYIADSKSSIIGILPMAASGQRVVDYNVIEKEPLYQIEDSDYEILLRIVEAEAGGEDENGKLLVANVVLNRLNNSKFPDTIKDVVFQKSKGVTQFSPVSNGRYWTVTVSEETVSAVNRALEGDDISQGALYFAARRYADNSRMRWFDEKLTFLFKHGGHEFFY